MFPLVLPQGFIVLLSSLILALLQAQAGATTKDLELGTVFMVSTTGPSDGRGGEIITDIVVRVMDSKSVQSFGITNRCFQVRRNQIREVGIGLGVSPELP
jgi:hypothetical protein